MTKADVIATARGIVTGELLVADLSRTEWQTSLALLLSGASKTELARVGLILVPMGPHHHTFWINGVAPGCTFEAQLVHRNDVSRLDAECQRMAAALFPEEVSDVDAG